LVRALGDLIFVFSGSCDLAIRWSHKFFDVDIAQDRAKLIAGIVAPTDPAYLVLAALNPALQNKVAQLILCVPALNKSMDHLL
jgi:hypothetical protein